MRSPRPTIGREGKTAYPAELWRLDTRSRVAAELSWS
jgi:hypothetical protein